MSQLPVLSIWTTSERDHHLPRGLRIASISLHVINHPMRDVGVWSLGEEFVGVSFNSKRGCSHAFAIPGSGSSYGWVKITIPLMKRWETRTKGIKNKDGELKSMQARI